MRTCCKKLLTTLICCLLVLFMAARDSTRVFPTHWWAGMKNTKLQLLVHADNIKSGSRVALKPYTGVKITSVHTYQNPNYLTIYLDISKTALPGKLTFTFNSENAPVAQ